MRFLLHCFLALSLLVPVHAFAQQKGGAVPDVPAPLQPLVDRGAQIRYLGQEHGMDGWITIYQGQEQYYYITQDKKAFVTGLMFGEDGRPITVDQVRDLQQQGGGVLDALAEAAPEEEKPATVNQSVSQLAATRTPAERMFAEVENSNWLRLGSAQAPVIYSFMDPKCPHCHDFIKDLKANYIDTGLIQIRMIPVGFFDGSLPQAAFLLAAPDAEARFFRHLDGDKDALPTKSDISTQAIQKNMALMQAWKFNVTPLTVYRSKSGEVKILRGVAKDIPGLLADLAPPGGSAALPLGGATPIPGSGF